MSLVLLTGVPGSHLRSASAGRQGRGFCIFMDFGLAGAMYVISSLASRRSKIYLDVILSLASRRRICFQLLNYIALKYRR
jgi:hypothetical protein